MTIALAFDGSCAQLSAAIVERRADDRLQSLHHCRLELDRGHAARLVPLLQQCLSAAAITLAQIDLLAVTVGPGSFTGVRIGLATARGLALATGTPLAGLSTLAVLHAAAAARAADEACCVAAIDSKRGDFYLEQRNALSAGGTGPAGPFLGDAAGLAGRLPAGRVRLIGDGAAMLEDALSRLGFDAVSDREIVAPDAVELAALALRAGADYWRERNRREGYPQPLYLRAADVGPASAAPPPG